MRFSHFVTVSCAFMAVSGTAIIDPNLNSRFAGSRGEKQDVMVSFTPGLDSVIEKINSQSFSSPAAKRSALVQAEEKFSDGTQAPLKALLKTRGVKYQSYSINNKMFISNADSGLVAAIASVPGVTKIEKEPVMHLSPYKIGKSEGARFASRPTKPTNNSLEWGVERVKADQVWGSFQGKGIVVAGIDTGVRGSHVTLASRWRQQYGWYDPYTLNFTKEPYDRNGHGTHTMGTIVGSHGIGVAPQAQWIACRGCNEWTCHAQTLSACGQWVMCPDKGTCAFTPNLVSNSWGGGEGDSWYDSIIKGWRTAGIIPIFAIGNSGPECKTANSPGDRPGVIAVGSTEENDQISTFSSLGPTKDGRLKPDIAAPGGEINSAWFMHDNDYKSISGTSMACPHVSGVIALMLEKNRKLKYDQVYDIITSTTNTKILDETTARMCGKPPQPNSQYPNNVFGYGLIDAQAAVNAVEES